ncbi:MAG: GNAT family N-acetyltransferase, partial [Halobacteria archaeon]|nr:GNAT family N-acetyltransferase [Halobacteria archaeon]
MEFEIRHATLDDGEDLLNLWHGFTDHLSEYDERYKHKESADERWLDYFSNQLVDSKYGTVIVAEGNGKILGVLEARVMGNHPIFRLKNHGKITGHYVREGYRRQGIGSAMIEEA